MRQTTTMSVPVKRKRQGLLQSFDEPLHTKYLSLGQIMMKRDRLLQQIWLKKKNMDAKNDEVVAMLQEVNKAIATLEESNLAQPTSDEVWVLISCRSVNVLELYLNLYYCFVCCRCITRTYITCWTRNYLNVLGQCRRHRFYCT